MRQFKLINTQAQEFDLMRTDAFYRDPSGLGFDIAFETLRTGYDFIEADSYQEAKQISGAMIFKGYAEYQEFVDFISVEGGLILAYKPLDKWYYINCKVASLSKTEITGLWRLNCPITFLCFGTWYEQTTVTPSGTVYEGGKIYDYTYDYNYAETSQIACDIENGNVETPLKIHIFGQCDTPYWALYQNSKKIADGRVNLLIQANQKLVVNAEPANMEIALYTTNDEFISSQYQNSDFTTERFIYAPAGNSRLVFSALSGDITATVEVNKRARTV